MEHSDKWAGSLREICYPVERYLLGYPVRDKERLAGAIISNAFLNETPDFERLKNDSADKSLATIGDYVLDFAILEHFPRKDRTTSQEINAYRERYGNNAALHDFSRTHLQLQNFILWGPDEKTRQVWDQGLVLADRFEMLIGVIYLEKDIGAVRTFLDKHNFFPAIDTFGKTS
jgi:dsRNA-specific ribonuclease